jgi:predicted Zn-dependent protease
LTVEPGRDVLDRLLDSGLEAAEVYVKRGRSRRFELDLGSEATLAAEEAGWAVRAAGRGTSFFFAATGTPAPVERWPAPIDEAALRLPPPAPIEGWSEPPEIGEALLGEDEGWRLLRRLTDDLGRRLPGATLNAILDDGASETRIWNHHGLDVAHRGRFAALRLEARAPHPGGTANAILLLAERSARRFAPATLVDRLVDLLAVRERGALDGAEGADIVLAPEVGARLLAPIAAAFCDRTPDQVATLLEVRDGRVASPAVALRDDGRHPRGALAAPVDGEGVPTGERALIEEGRLAGTILSWERSGAPLGCRVRAGWRDLPRVAPSHCFVVPQPEVAPSSLVEDLRQGFYLLDAGDGGSYDLAAGLFSLPVWGFRIAAGRPLHPLGEARLMGDPRGLLHAVCGVARDLRFAPLGAMIGAPSLLMRGLTLRQNDG